MIEGENGGFYPFGSSEWAGQLIAGVNKETLAYCLIFDSSLGKFRPLKASDLGGGGGEPQPTSGVESILGLDGVITRQPFLDELNLQISDIANLLNKLSTKHLLLRFLAVILQKF